MEGDFLADFDLFPKAEHQEAAVWVVGQAPRLRRHLLEKRMAAEQRSVAPQVLSR